LSAELETRVDQLKASESDLKNIVYREKDAREVPEYEYKQLAHECIYHMELREASDRDLVNCYKSLQKLNEDCEKLRGQLKELEEATLPFARLLVPHLGRPKIAPLVDRLKEAPGRLATYVKHLVKSIPNQVLAYMKSYFPKAPVDVVAGGLAENCTDEDPSGGDGANCRAGGGKVEPLVGVPIGLACSSTCNINRVNDNLFKLWMRFVHDISMG
jgi:hypothetical protein